MNSVSLEEWLPIMKVVSDCVISKRGDLTFGWRLYPPVIYTVDEQGYDSIVNSMAQACKALPMYSIIHKQDIFRFDTFPAKDSPHFLRRSYYRHFAGRKFLNNYSYIYVTFSSRQNLERKTNESYFMSSAKPAGMPDAATIRSCADAASRFESILSANPLIGIEKLTSADFVRAGEHGKDEGVIPDYLRFYDSDKPDYNHLFDKDGGKYGNDHFAVWYVEDSDAYPDNVSSAKFMSEMSTRNSSIFLSGGSPIGVDLKIPHVVNRYLALIPKEGIMKDLDMKKRLNTSFSSVSSESAVNARELASYMLDAADNSFVTVKTFMNLIAWGSKAALPDIRNKVVTAFRTELDLTVTEETLTAPLLYYAGIPGAEAELGYDCYLNSERTSFLCHGLWDGYDNGGEGDIIHVCDRNSMTPKTIDIQSKARESGRINAMNVVVVGPTGSGKSFTMNSLVEDFYEADEHIVILDVGDSYMTQARVVNEESKGKDGIYITYDPANPFGFNPFKGFRHWGDVDEDGEMANSGIAFFLSLVQTIYKPIEGWSSEASSALKHFIGEFLDWWEHGVPGSVSLALKEAYSNERRRRAIRNGLDFDESNALDGYVDAIENIFIPDRAGKDPLFDDFVRYISGIVSPLVRDDNYKIDNVSFSNKIIDMDRFSIALDMFKKGGTYGYFLNEAEEKDLFSSRFTVFELDRIKDDANIFPLLVLLIMHGFEDKMRNLDCHKVMIIEEAWKAISTETMANYIVWLWRTARKFRTSAVVVTQDIEDIISSEIVKNAIIVNSDVRILLDQRANANNFERAVNVLGLTPMATNLVLSVNKALNPDYHYKEAFFAVGPAHSDVYAIEVSPEQALCFESEKKKKAPLYALAKERGSMIAAIKEMAERLNSK